MEQFDGQWKLDISKEKSETNACVASKKLHRLPNINLFSKLTLLKKLYNCLDWH